MDATRTFYGPEDLPSALKGPVGWLPMARRVGRGANIVLDGLCPVQGTKADDEIIVYVKVTCAGGGDWSIRALGSADFFERFKTGKGPFNVADRALVQTPDADHPCLVTISVKQG